MEILHEIVKKRQTLPVKVFEFKTNNSGRITPHHWHRSVEILFCVSGRLRTWIFDQEYQLQIGELLIINSDTIHAIQSLDCNDIIVLQFEYDFLKQYTSYEYDEKWRFVSKPVSYQWPERFMMLRNDDSKSELQNNLQKMALIFKILLDLTIVGTQELQQLSAKNNHNIEQMSRVMEFINQNYQQTISLKMISQQFGYSEGYFSRFFKATMGMSYYRYLNIIRLNAAYSDMKYTNKSLVDIALECGFKDYRNFYNVFVSNYHVAPRVYRKNNFKRS